MSHWFPSLGDPRSMPIDLFDRLLGRWHRVAKLSNGTVTDAELTEWRADELSSFGGSINMADIIVEITARNELLRRQLLEAERMTKASADRMGRTSAFGFGGGRLPIAGMLGRGTAIGLGVASVTSGTKLLEANFRLIQAAAQAIDGDWSRAGATIMEANRAWSQAIYKLPIVGGLIDDATTSIADLFAMIIKDVSGITKEQEKAERMRQSALRNTERAIQNRAGQRPNSPFAVSTSIGTAQVGSGQVFVADSIDRQTRTLEEMRDTLKGLDRTVNSLALVSSQ